MAVLMLLAFYIYRFYMGVLLYTGETGAGRGGGGGRKGRQRFVFCKCVFISQ